MTTTTSLSIDHNRLPISEELLHYYKLRIEQNEAELASYIQSVQSIKTANTEFHKLTCELHLRADEIKQLQACISEAQAELITERKQLLKLLNENDQLRIQELKDRRKIRYLLGLCHANVPEDETTYFKPNIHHALIVDSQSAIPSSHLTNEARLEYTESQEPGLSLRDENQILRLQVQALQCQLQDQAKVQQESIDRLLHDAQIRANEDKLRSQADSSRVKDLTDKINKYQDVLAENTKEVLTIRKTYLVNERLLKEERVRLIEECNTLRTRYMDLKSKNEVVERAVESRVTKRTDKLLMDLRSQLAKYDKELKSCRLDYAEKEIASKKKIEILTRKADTLRNDYTALKKRRGYEIEGFTNDIVQLRTRIKDLERHIVKIAPLFQAESAMLQMMDKAIQRADRLEKKFQMQNAFT